MNMCLISPNRTRITRIQRIFTDRICENPYHPRYPRSIWALLVVLLLLSPAMARAQNELLEPYNLHIVVHVAENRLLTDVFRRRIERELHDGFQAALGEMGRVTVDSKHPRLADVLARGLKQSLDEWKDHDDRKTHFVLIDYSGVHYEIQTRQYDGTVGRASPVVRYDRTRDRDFVAKAAALLIKHDFGVLGTVRTESEGAKKQVKIELRGGGLGDLSRWVKKDDVFALAPPGGGTLEALKWSLLQVEQAPAEDAHDGVCVCRFFHRYEVPNIVGYRCIKLGTVQTPLRLRWMQKQRVAGGFRIKPLDQRLMVEIRRNGFDGEEGTKLEKSSDLNGVLETVRDKNGTFNNVAFVRVIEGPVDPKPQVPIALVDDQPVTIEVNAANSPDSLFTISLTNWQKKVSDSVQMQANLFKRLEVLGAKAENRGEIIDVAQNGLKRAQADRGDLQKQKEVLVELAKKNNKDLKTTIEDRRLQQLEKYEQALSQFIEEQQKIEATENDPQRKQWLREIQNALLLEKDFKYDEAIAIYERIQKEGYNDDKLTKHVEELHEVWDPKSDEHKEARDFIYRVWPTLDSSRLEEKIPTARKAFETCKKARKGGDLISIGKLLKGTEGHADELNKILNDLLPDLQIEDAKKQQQLKPVIEQIVKLGEEIQDYLKAHANDK